MPIVFPRPFASLGTTIVDFLHDRGIHSPQITEMWRSYSSAGRCGEPQGVVRTMRGVIEPGGQTVSALDRLYLAGNLPTLIVWGDEDGIIPIDHAHAAHEAIPGSRLEILEGVGHFPHAEAPERFVEVLREFLAETDPGPVSEIDCAARSSTPPPERSAGRPTSGSLGPVQRLAGFVRSGGNRRRIHARSGPDE